RGDLDIWVSQRATRSAPWSQPENVAALNSAGKDIPRPLGQHQRVMPLGSDRDTRNYYQIYFAPRADTDADEAAFEAPQRVEALATPTMSTVDAFLSDDGLTLFYVRGPAFGPADLFVAQRRSTDEPFMPGAPLS